MMRVRAGFIAALAVATTGCGDVFGPPDIEFVTPDIRSVGVDRIGTVGPTGILHIYALPESDRFRLEHHERVAVELSTSNGDRERAALYHRVCPPRPGYATYHCFRYLFVLREGADQSAVVARLRAEGDVTLQLGASGGGYVTRTRPDGLVARLREVQAWPEIQVAERDAMCFGYCSPPPQATLMLPVPLRAGGPVHGNGVVEATTGDTVHVVYRGSGALRTAFSVIE